VPPLLWRKIYCQENLRHRTAIYCIKISHRMMSKRSKLLHKSPTPSPPKKTWNIVNNISCICDNSWLLLRCQNIKPTVKGMGTLGPQRFDFNANQSINQSIFCNENQLDWLYILIYLVIQSLHISGMFTAHHQEVFTVDVQRLVRVHTFKLTGSCESPKRVTRIKMQGQQNIQ
jgi:hypothetical protein